MLSDRGVFVAAMSALLASGAGAQCMPEWSGAFGPGDPDGSILTMAWFDDGTGMRLFAAGAFDVIGGAQTGGLARWDGTSWSAAPEPGTGEIFRRLRVAPDARGVERLFVTGRFSVEGSSFVAAWDGSAFVPLPPSPTWRGIANDAAIFDPDGDGPSPSLLVVSGGFSSGADVRTALAWDGEVWTPVGSTGDGDGGPLALFDPDGAGPMTPYVAMSLSSGAGSAYWSYSGPESIGGSGVFVPMPQRASFIAAADLVVFDADGPKGDPARLLAVGRSSSAISVLASFDGTAWTEIQSEAMLGGSSLKSAGLWDRDGEGPLPRVLALVGTARLTTTSSVSVVTWDGSSFAFEDTKRGNVGAALPPGATGVEGLPTLALGDAPPGVLTPGGEAHSRFVVYRDGEFIDEGVPPQGAPNATILRAVVWDADGDGPNPPALVANGFSALTSVGEVYTGSVATLRSGVWSGEVAAPFDFFAPGYVLVAADQDGTGPGGAELWATGATPLPASTYVRRWTGSTWEQVPGSRTSQTTRIVAAVSFDFDGDGPMPPQLVVGGRIPGISSPQITTNNVASFDGSAWHALGNGFNNDVTDLAIVDLDGDGPAGPSLFACGWIGGAGTPPIRGVAVWNGTGWSGLQSLLSNSIVYSLEVVDFDGVGGNPPVLAMAGDIYMLIGDSPRPQRRPLVYWDGQTLTPAPGFSSVDVIDALATFDVDGAGPGSEVLYVISRLAPRIRRVTPSGPEPLDAGDVNAAGRMLVVFDEDGAGANAGGLYVFGDFTRAGDVPSGYIARWGCPGDPACSADWDRNGTVNSTDVSEFINDWFTDQAEGTLVTDWDQNGVVNSTDVSNFINAWFEQSGNPGCG